MERKRKSKKRKIGKILILAMSFVLTIVLTATATLAWFYDSDWANTTVTMAGSVGIEMRNSNKTATSGAGLFHFKLGNGATLAYPGQSIDVQANVFNNGGDSVSTWWNNQTTEFKNGATAPTDSQIAASGEGSACYVRARFVVYTDIGKQLTGEQLASQYPVREEPAEPDYDTATQAELNTYYTQMKQYKQYLEYESDRNMGAQELYEALVTMITDVNDDQSTGYDWVFWENTEPTMTLDSKTYFEGKQQSATAGDGGYFYLCYGSDSTDTTITSKTGFTAQKTLKPLTVGETAAFLWNGVFVIPWQLTNLSADKTIFIACEFQAIQTFIPLISAGKISGLSNNQLPAEYCYYNDISIQTVFNSSRFTNFEELTTDAQGKVYSQDSNFIKASLPKSTGSVYLSGTAQANAYNPTPPAQD